MKRLKVRAALSTFFLCAVSVPVGACSSQPSDAVADTAQADTPGNMLHNGDFVIASPGTVGAVTLMAPAISGGTAAASWSAYNNTPAQTTTWRTTVDGGPALHTFAGGHADGIVQVFAPYNTVTGPARFKIDVKVLEGQVSGMLGNGGSGSGHGEQILQSNVVADATWHTLSGCGRPDGKNNEVFLYAINGAADFYTRNATVLPDAACGGCPAHAHDWPIGTPCTELLDCKYPSACGPAGAVDDWHCKLGTWQPNTCYGQCC